MPGLIWESSSLGWWDSEVCSHCADLRPSEQEQQCCSPLERLLHVSGVDHNPKRLESQRLTWDPVSKSSNVVARWRDIDRSVMLIIIPKDWNPRDQNAKSLSSHWKEGYTKVMESLTEGREWGFVPRIAAPMFSRVNTWKLVQITVGCAVKIFLQEIHMCVWLG